MKSPAKRGSLLTQTTPDSKKCLSAQKERRISESIIASQSQSPSQKIRCFSSSQLSQPLAQSTQKSPPKKTNPEPLKSVLFTASDDENDERTVYPKTPGLAKSKSYILDGSNNVDKDDTFKSSKKDHSEGGSFDDDNDKEVEEGTAVHDTKTPHKLKSLGGVESSTPIQQKNSPQKNPKSVEILAKDIAAKEYVFSEDDDDDDDDKQQLSSFQKSFSQSYSRKAGNTPKVDPVVQETSIAEKKTEGSFQDIQQIPDESPPKRKKTGNEDKYRSNMDEEFLNRMENLVHPDWDLQDPTPDINALFRAFDDKFFKKRLSCVTLEWSKRMYSRAGICYSRRNGLDMAITIRLSEPLLKFRPRKDLVETMLHEMIHAYCFVLGIREGNGGHGPNFKKIMNGINKVAGTNITVYHTFHAEVNEYKTHWWLCNGICQYRPPLFGYVKRTSNRPPSSNAFFWKQHLESCGGTFMKIKEPEKPAKKTKAIKQPKSKAIEANNVISKPPKSNESDLRKFFPPTSLPGARGPVKSNGGGTLLLNPKTKPVTTAIQTTPPTAPRPVRSQGNLTNVVGFKDLGEDGAPKTPSTAATPRDFSMTGNGYSLNGSCSSGQPSDKEEKEVDRNHLHNVFLKRFSNTKEPEIKTEGKDAASGNAKRRRLSAASDDPAEVVFVADEVKSKSDWEVIDDDVMVKQTVIDISSSSENEDADSDSGQSSEIPRIQMVFADADERQKQIMKEILDESGHLTCDGNDDDIVLIDDDIVLIDDDIVLIDDDIVLIDDDDDAMELADTSLVDDLFGGDTLLKEFKNENAVLPSCSRYKNETQKDIITCSICQEKMKRENFSEHLDGCHRKVKLDFGSKKSAISKKSISSTPKKKRPASTAAEPSSSSRRPQKSAKTREILLSAGYTEEDLENLPELNEESATSNSPTSSPQEDLNLSERQRRSNGLYRETRPCPACCKEVEVDRINEHLDECLE